MTSDLDTTLDLSFPAFATDTLPADHGYSLLGAISRNIPEFHSTNGIAVHPIPGRIIGRRKLRLCAWSDLRLRLLDNQVAIAIRLAGKLLHVDGTSIRLGVPRVFSLEPAPCIRCRLATIKGFMEPEPFEQAVRRQLDAIDASSGIEIDVGHRRTLRVRDKEIVGFELRLSELLPRDSLAIQMSGVGGRRHMGCGVFRPVKSKIQGVA